MALIYRVAVRGWPRVAQPPDNLVEFRRRDGIGTTDLR
jgi:hypothetical protein